MHSTSHQVSARWRAHIDAQARSGQPQKGFCASLGISYASFGNWKRRLSQGRVGSPGDGMFIPLMPTAVGQEVMRVSLPTVIVLEVPIGSNPKLLGHIPGGTETK